MNIEWSKRILRELYKRGVRDVVFCAGARNSPFIAVLNEVSGIERHSFFEERSAAFFALGAARRSNRPVAVITTSGTAAAELLPATIEAYHTGVPLVLVTADRPKRLRGTGAPQAIDQTGLYTKFIDQEFDLEDGADVSLENWNQRKPIHLNICFDEPLLDNQDFALDLHKEPLHSTPGFLGCSTFAETTSAEWAAMRIAKFLRTSGTLLTVVGTLETVAEREAVAELLLRLKSPVYLEGTSGLREDARLQDLALKSGDRVLAWALKKNLISRVLRVGGVPTVRIWRDLEEPLSPVDVLSLTNLPFSGLSRGEMVCAEIASAAALAAQELDSRVSLGLQNEASLHLMTKDREIEAKLNQLFEGEPLAEPSMVHALSRLIPEDAMVYVGNSLPIRHWDLAAHRRLSSARGLEANRGVNGIDGQVSSFIGLARPRVENWALLGDLTALYDLTAPWALAYRPEAKVRLVVLNNGGGKIFSRIFQNPLFENRHALGFAGWAQMWSLSYQKWLEVPTRFSGEQVEVIELVPDSAATERFWAQHDSWWT